MYNLKSYADFIEYNAFQHFKNGTGAMGLHGPTLLWKYLMSSIVYRINLFFDII